MHHSAIASLVAKSFQRIQSHILRTPLVYDAVHHLQLKCEQQQHTGSFKWRGALSKLSTLQAGETVVTASTGNHGLGVVKAAELYGLRVIVFLPESATAQKKAKLVNLGVNLMEVPGDSLAAELEAKSFALHNHLAWVSPYNDPEVIAGQGTIGLELTEQLPLIDKIYVTVGGGGLVSGIAGWIKTHSPDTEIIGCQPLNSPEMYLSVQAGHVVQAPESLATLSDGSAGPLEPDSITFPICAQLIDRFILVDEEAIRWAIREAYHRHGMMIEGAAGVALAAAARDENRSATEQSVVILCGGNIDPKLHHSICANT